MSALALRGMTVVVAGSGSTVAAIADELRAAGVSAVPAVVLDTVPPDDPTALERALDELEAGGFDTLVVTSEATVGMLTARMSTVGPPGLRVAAVGPRTRSALEAAGIAVAIEPELGSARGLLDAWPPGPRGRVLLPQSDLADGALAAGLRALGEDVIEVVSYRTVARAAPPAAVEALAGGALLVVTSPSALRAIGSHASRDAPVVAIGSRTADSARSTGWEVVAVAARPTPREVADAVLRAGSAAPGR